MDERALARAGDAGDAGEDAEGDADVDVLEVVLVGVADLEEGLRRRPPRGRQGDLLLAADVLGRERVAAAEEARPGAGEDDLAAGLAGARAHVDDVLGGPDDVGVVLDDDDRVADVLERLEDLDEAVVVAGVEADRGLVEDEERPDERGAEGRGQADALGLAAAQGEGHAVEGDVVEADLQEEAQAAADLLDELLGHLALERLELEAGEEGGGLADGHADDLADVEALDPDAQGPGVEPGLGAGRAGDVFPVAAEQDPDLDLVLLGLEPVEEALDAVVAVAAVEDEALVLRLEVAEGDVGRDLPPAGLGQELLLHALGQRLRPGLDRALLQGLGACRG